MTLTSLSFPFPCYWWGVSLEHAGLGEVRPDLGTYGRYGFKNLPSPPIALRGDYAWLESAHTHDRNIEAGRAVELSEALSNLADFAADIDIRLPEAFTHFMSTPALQRKVRSCTDCFLDLCPEPTRSPIGRGYLLRFLADSQACHFWYLHLRHGETGHRILSSPDFYGKKEERWHDETPDPFQLVYCAESFEEFIWRFWIENEIWHASFDGSPMSDACRDYVEKYLSRSRRPDWMGPPSILHKSILDSSPARSPSFEPPHGFNGATWATRCSTMGVSSGMPDHPSPAGPTRRMMVRRRYGEGRRVFWTDYRVILRRFEFDRLMDPPSAGDDTFGGRYSNGLLAAFYETDASKLNRTFRRLTEAQRTLYALNALCGQIDNGGISQFFFNVQPLLRDEVKNALGRIGAIEFLREYSKVLESVQDNSRLAEIRSSATEWDDYLEYKSEMGGEKSVNAAFDDWYFAGQAANLDRFMRGYIEGREGDLVRYCDEDRRLQARWTAERLGRLVADFDDYRENADRGGSFGFFDSLFVPELRERFGDSGEERRENARKVAEAIMPVIRRAARRPSIAAYADRPVPRISIDGDAPRGGHIVIQIHEDEHALRWSIADWEQPTPRS